MRIESFHQSSYLLSEFEFLLDPENRYVVFDLETTGPDQKLDRITQIGAVVVNEDGPNNDEFFKSLVHPDKTIPPKIEKLTGITNDMVAEAPELSIVWSDFLEFCRGSTLVTQCGYEFDFPLIQSECERLNLPELEQQKLDTKAIFALMHPDRSEIFSTDYLAGYYGVDQNEFKRHDALGDAQLISRFFHKQLEEAKELGIKKLYSKTPIEVKKAVLPKL